MKSMKICLLFIVLLIVSGPLSAQRLIAEADGYKLKVVLDHEDALYKVGEPIVYSVSLTLEGQPVPEATIAWKCTKDSFFPKLEGELTIKNGKAEYRSKLDEPGFLQFRATFVTPQKSTLSQLSAAGVEPEKIEPSMPAPDDFKTYWEKLRKEQEKMPVNLKMTPVKTSVKGVEAFAVEADCLAGAFTGYVCRPAGATAKSLPAMLRLEGAGVASAQLPVAAKWAAKGLVVIDFNVNGLPNGKERAFYQELNKGAYRQYYMKGTEHRDSLFFRKMILRLMRSIDIVTSQPEWDGENIIAFGRSQGGGQALIAGGLDERVKLVCAEIPAVCDHTGPVVGRIGGWPKLLNVDKEGKIADPKQVEAVRYADALHFAPYIKGKTYVTVGFIDLSCAPTSVYSVYNQIKAPKDILHHKYTGHVQTREGEAYVAQAVMGFLDSLKK